MPIVHHDTLDETPWRPDYRKWNITREGDGTEKSNLSYSEVGKGTGSPLHVHDIDELMVVLDGVIEVRLGDEIQQVGSGHTIVVPPNTPHSFRNVGQTNARILDFFPVSDPSKHTRYIEGQPPSSG